MFPETGEEWVPNYFRHETEESLLDGLPTLTVSEPRARVQTDAYISMSG